MPKWELPAHVRDQVSRAMVSVLLNTAEGCGKVSRRDKCRFYATARGSLLEVSAGLDVATTLGKLSKMEHETLQGELLIITKMFSKLIQVTSLSQS